MEEADTSAPTDQVEPLSFADYGVNPDICQRLAKRGITSPFEIQALVLKDALDGRDILGKAKTGSGKTLAFGVPLIQGLKPGVKGTQALVLVPTRELASQVADELRAISSEPNRIVACYGGVGLGKHLQQAPTAQVLVATPGRLIDLMERRAAKLGNIQLLVIDEADRMADMGFLPQVTRILREVPQKRQTLLFSATLDGQILGLVAQTADPIRHEVAETQMTVEGVEHHLFEVQHMDKTDVLIALLTKAPRGRTLVFVRTKRGCDKLALRLRKDGLKATAIHGDLAQGAREKALKRFEDGSVDVLVATDVAARGLDIDDITHVVNFDMPEDHKAYLHRIGRTARAGRTGVGITLATWQQRDEIERMAKRLHLHPHIVEMVSTDDRIEKVGSGELEYARPNPNASDRKESGAYARLSRNKRKGGARRPSGRRR